MRKSELTREKQRLLWEDISSRADINRAKKSTVMDSYLALSGKTINTLKQEYSEYESENYRIVPDNEAECFDIYNKDGERLGHFPILI